MMDYNRNNLDRASSPYLQQHRDNPVHWQSWHQDVFDQARKEDRPVLVSIGYSTCHWCHVMAHQCFEDDHAAKIMNKAMLCIKVDREEHPGVDAVYMESLQAMTGSGGWPLNAFTDHQGRPFLAVTYLPKDRWIALIDEIVRIWTYERDKIYQSAQSIYEHLNTGHNSRSTKDWQGITAIFREDLQRSYDNHHPGFIQGADARHSMKFPPCQSIDWLLEYGDDREKEMGLNILKAMMDSGLHDRVGGGFHRYSVDAQWRIPHFEKMTYDNAQLMGLYARASDMTPSKIDRKSMMGTARKIADWFMEDMRVYDKDSIFSGYASAMDADDPLGEGSFYAWSPSALYKVLDPSDADWLIDHWNLSDKPTTEVDSSGHFEPVPEWIPHPRGASTENPTQADIEREQRLCSRLRTARAERPAPARDDKVLTDQNALVLEGLVRLSRYGDQSEAGQKYRQMARELADVLVKKIGGQDQNMVKRTDTIDGYITDYGCLSMALVAAFGLLGDKIFIKAAENTAQAAFEQFSAGDGSYFATGTDDLALFKRPQERYDGPFPAGQHALGIAFSRLYNVTGRPHWREKARCLLEACGESGKNVAAGVPSLVRLASLHTSRLHSIVVTGSADSKQTQKLLVLARSYAGPDQIPFSLAQVMDSDRPDWPLLQDLPVVKTDPAIQICREGICMLPARTVDEIKTALQGFFPDSNV